MHLECHLQKSALNTHTRSSRVMPRTTTDDDEEEDEEKMVVSSFSSALRDVLLSRPKDASRAIVDAAFEMHFFQKTSSDATKRFGDDDDDKREEEEERREHDAVKKEDDDDRLLLSKLARRLEEVAVTRIVDDFETVEKVVETYVFPPKRKEKDEDEEEEDHVDILYEKARNRLKKILGERTKAWMHEKKNRTDDGAPAAAASGDETSGGRRRRRRRSVTTPRLVAYDWTAYATRASSESLVLVKNDVDDGVHSRHDAIDFDAPLPSSRVALSLRVASSSPSSEKKTKTKNNKNKNKNNEEEEEEEEEENDDETITHRLDLDVDSLSVLVDALRDANTAVAFAG